MDINWPAFLGVVVAAYVIPGPDFAVILRWATRGWRPGLAAAAGAQLGLCVHMLLAVVGLSVVLASHAGLLTAVRVVGGLSLACLGGRRIVPPFRRRARTAAQGPGPTAGQPVDERARRAFVQALMTNLTNPKAILFFAAVLPQFLGSGPAPLWLQTGVLGVVDVLVGFAPWAVVVVVGVRLSRTLRRETVRRWWDRVTGAVLGGAGVTVLARG